MEAARGCSTAYSCYSSFRPTGQWCGLQGPGPCTEFPTPCSCVPAVRPCKRWFWTASPHWLCGLLWAYVIIFPPKFPAPGDVRPIFTLHSPTAPGSHPTLLKHRYNLVVSNIKINRGDSTCEFSETPVGTSVKNQFMVFESKQNAKLRFSNKQRLMSRKHAKCIRQEQVSNRQDLLDMSMKIRLQISEQYAIIDNNKSHNSLGL